MVILYRPNSEHGNAVDTFIRDFKATHGDARVEILDADSRDGSAMASLYDIMQFPTIMALRNDGSVLKSWEGESLPLMDEVAYYTYSGE